MKYLCDVLKEFMRENNMDTTEMADAADVGDMAIRCVLTNDTEKVSEKTIKNIMRVMGVTEDDVIIVKPSQHIYQKISYQKPDTKYILSMERDGVVKYCCSYTAEITPDTMYWMGDDMMANPYAFRSFKMAEALYWSWQKRTEQKGWYFTIREVQ